MNSAFLAISTSDNGRSRFAGQYSICRLTDRACAARRSKRRRHFLILRRDVMRRCLGSVAWIDEQHAGITFDAASTCLIETDRRSVGVVGQDECLHQTVIPNETPQVSHHLRANPPTPKCVGDTHFIDKQRAVQKTRARGNRRWRRWSSPSARPLAPTKAARHPRVKTGSLLPKVKSGSLLGSRTDIPFISK